MKTYADTSLLFSLYSTDINSPKADAWRKANVDPLPFTAFHRLELRNALNLAVFQKRLTPGEVQSAWQEVENDIAAGFLIGSGGLWHRVLAGAESIARLHNHGRLPDAGRVAHRHRQVNRSVCVLYI